MGDKTGIEWTDATWNPLIGCSLKSAGCKNCYAMRVAHRFQGTHEHYKGTTKLLKIGPHWTGAVNQAPIEILDQPLRWTRPRMVFVNSMSDLFHENVPFEFIAAIFGIMASCSQHTFQVLTKRPERALEFQEWLMRVTNCHPVLLCLGEAENLLGVELQEKWMAMMRPGEIHPQGPWPLKNVWFGTSIENKEMADERMPLLLQFCAEVLWVSAEPLIGPVDLQIDHSRYRDDPAGRFGRLGWVVVGGESGYGARPMPEAWALDLMLQCERVGVPFLFKQWGEWEPVGDRVEFDDGPVEAANAGEGFSRRLSDGKRRILYRVVDGKWMRRVGKKKAGRRLDGRLHDGYPERIAA